MSSKSAINEIDDYDVKLSAILSHYVYFYLDWLEYVHFHVHSKGSIWEQFKNAITQNGLDVYQGSLEYDIESDFGIQQKPEEIPVPEDPNKNLGQRLLDGAAMAGKGVLTIGKIPYDIASGIVKYPFSGAERVKVRIVNRLKEIATITGKVDPKGEVTNKGIDNIIEVLSESQKAGRPMEFFDLYEIFGYWTYVNDAKLTQLAKKWHVSHPYLVFKHDYPIEVHDVLGINRKSNELFIPKPNEKEGRDPICYNTILTHGMSQLSGYGGLLFVEVEKKEVNGKIEYNDTRYCYCTKGTDVNSINDWVFVDILQGFTGFSLQHVHTVYNAIIIDDAVAERSKGLFFCGHSLGGGLASSNAIAAKGRHAVTFNAAGLNFLGVLATRTVSGMRLNSDAIWPLAIAKRVHPIRIKGEVVDELMKLAKILTINLNERAYGYAPLVLDLRDGIRFLWTTAAKHGINNFLYKSLINALRLVDKETEMVAVSKQTGKKLSLRLSDFAEGDFIWVNKSVSAKELKKMAAARS